MNTKEFCEYNPREFERVCLYYARKKYDENATVILTPPQNDGGCDIQISFSDKEDIHWGECKHHKRNIDLSTIGKNIVLVLSHKVRKIIFFSTSNIVYNTKKEILKVAKEYNFKAVFLDGENLFLELSRFGILEEENKASANQRYGIEVYAEETETNDVSSNYIRTAYDSMLTLKSSGNFSLFLIVKNHSFQELTITLKFISFPDTKIKGIPQSVRVSLSPFSDQSLKFGMYTSLRYREIEKLPNIRVTACQMTETIDTGSIQANFYPVIPLTGQDVYNNLNSVKELLLSEEHINIIDIRGEEGCGKSRLISESLQCLSENDSFYYISAANGECHSMLKQLFADILKIPFERNENVPKAIFDSVLCNTNINQELKDFIFTFFTDHLLLNEQERKCVYSFFIECIVYSNNNTNVLVFDDIDKAEKLTSYFLIDLLSFLKYNVPVGKLRILIAGDYEKRTHKHKNVDYNTCVRLISILSEIHEANHSEPIVCYELNEHDKVMYCMEILGIEEKQCAQLIAKNFPGNPAVLNSVCFPLIALPLDKRIALINSEIENTKKSPIGTLVQTLTLRKFVEIKDKAYRNQGILMVKFLILFHGAVPYSFVKYNQFDESVLNNMIGERFIIFDIDSQTYRFHQDCYLNCIRDVSPFNSISVEAKKVIQWIDIKTDKKFDEIKFQCLIAINQYKEAYIFGYNTVMRESIYTNVNVCRRIIELLLKIPSIEITTEQNYFLTKRLAHIYLFNNNFKQGKKYFKKAYQLAKRRIQIIGEAEFYQIRHEYLNSLIHSAQYEKALAFLSNIDSDKIKLIKYRFLFYNRYGVISTFLNEPEKAKYYLDNAQRIALEMNDEFMISTNYSDYAYLYLKTNQKKRAGELFAQAANLYSSCDYTELYRDIEVKEQLALSSALCDNYEEAGNYIEQALKLCEENYRDYTWLKAKFINGYIFVCQGSYQEAERVYKDCIARAKIFGSEIYLIYSYATLSALNMLQNKPSSVEKNYEKIKKMFKTSRFEGKGAQLAILKNFALWYYRNRNESKLTEMKFWTLPELDKYIASLHVNKAFLSLYATKSAQTAANVEGYSFLF